MTPENPFETLGIKPAFDLDLPTVEKTYRELARALHPDRFQDALPTERRNALSKAIVLNEAWRTLQDPLKRAEALFRLRGVALGERGEPAASPDFLMEMMDQREELGTARASGDVAQVRKIAERAKAASERCEQKLRQAFSQNESSAALERSVALLGEIRFHRRLLEETEATLFDAMDPPHDPL